MVIAAVGRPSKLVAPAIAEYEKRAGRYWKLETAEVKAERAAGNRPITEVRQEEAARLRPAAEGLELVALTRGGDTWSSAQLARYLNELAIRGGPGAAFVIGGAFGLDRGLLKEAHRTLSLSTLTMPHDMARLVFTEQLYRAGTIIRGEPYHKG